MLLVDLTFDEIVKYMEKEKIPLTNVEFNFNGADSYKIDMQLSEDQKERFKAKLKELSNPKKRIDLLVKNEHGSYEKMDKFYNKSKGCYRALYKRRYNALNSIMHLVKGKVSIVSE